MFCPFISYAWNVLSEQKDTQYIYLVCIDIGKVQIVFGYKSFKMQFPCLFTTRTSLWSM